MKFPCLWTSLCNIDNISCNNLLYAFNATFTLKIYFLYGRPNSQILKLTVIGIIVLL